MTNAKGKVPKTSPEWCRLKVCFYWPQHPPIIFNDCHSCIHIRADWKTP
ncbi:hypothetical protein ES703_22436 [subsurface metagenome]